MNAAAADADLKRVAQGVASLLASRSELSRYDAARHEDSLVALLWQPALERNPSLVARPEATRAALNDALAAGTHVVMVLETHGMLEGALWVSVGREAAGVVLHLLEIVLVPAARQAGRGAALMGHLHEAARASGVVALTLDFMADNARVESFYRRLGYEVIGLDLRRPPGARSVPARGVSWPYEASRDRAFAEPAIGAQARKHRLRQDSGSAAWQQLETELRVGTAQVILAGPELGKPLGLVWYEPTSSRLSGEKIAILRELVARGPDPAPTLATLLNDVERNAASAGRGVEAFLTVWSPTQEERATLLDLGFVLGRTKMCKVLGS